MWERGGGVGGLLATLISPSPHNLPSGCSSLSLAPGERADHPGVMPLRAPLGYPEIVPWADAAPCTPPGLSHSCTPGQHHPIHPWLPTHICTLPIKQDRQPAAPHPPTLPSARCRRLLCAPSLPALQAVEKVRQGFSKAESTWLRAEAASTSPSPAAPPGRSSV